MTSTESFCFLRERKESFNTSFGIATYGAVESPGPFIVSFGHVEKSSDTCTCMWGVLLVYERSEFYIVIVYERSEFYIVIVVEEIDRGEGGIHGCLDEQGRTE